MALGKNLPIILLVVSIIIVLIAIYGWINASVSLDHCHQQQVSEKNRSVILKQLVTMVAGNKSRSELTVEITSLFNKEHIVKVKQDRIEIDDIILEFKGEVLSRVAFLGEDYE